MNILNLFLGASLDSKLPAFITQSGSVHFVCAIVGIKQE